MQNVGHLTMEGANRVRGREERLGRKSPASQLPPIRVAQKQLRFTEFCLVWTEFRAGQLEGEIEED